MLVGGGGGGNRGWGEEVLLGTDRGQPMKEKFNSFPLFRTFTRLVEREWDSPCAFLGKPIIQPVVMR